MANLLGPFQIVIHRSAQTSTALLAGTQQTTAFSVSFEDVFAVLETWPRMFIEPDGSFVWVGQEPQLDGTLAAWQLDGHLYDRDRRLLYVELQGTCPRSAWEQILAACGSTLAEILVEQRYAGTTSSAAEFLKTAVD